MPFYLIMLQSVTLVVYCVDLSEYDSTETAGPSTNKLAESIHNFENYFNVYFTEASFLVILSNFALFKGIYSQLIKLLLCFI